MKRFMALMLCACGAASVFAQNTEAFIREMTGTVELKTPGSAEWITARPGDRVDEAAIISTGFKSMATLSIGNSTLLVRALTRMSLNEIRNQNETEMVNIGLSTGRVRADIKPPAGGRTNFSVQTPIATASVRGTVFDLDANTIQVVEGAVSYAPAGEAARPVTVSAGQESWADADTGQAVAPAIAAEVNFAPPSLPGQSAAAGVSGGTLPSVESPVGRTDPGTLIIGVNLTK